MDHLQGPRQHCARPPLLLAGHGQGREAAKTRSIAIGFQVVLGTLVNAILNDPGPLSIQDREMEVRLGHCLLLLLQAGDDAAGDGCFAQTQAMSTSGSACAGTGPSPPFSPENAPPSVLAKARTERVERRTGEGGDLHDPAPADCPDIDATY